MRGKPKRLDRPLSDRAAGIVTLALIVALCALGIWGWFYEN